MKKIKLDDTSIYNGVNPKDVTMELWKKNFLHESAKFISSTHLQPSDYEREFEDEYGEKWKIVGQMDGKDMPCEKLSTGEIFIWDRWNVSAMVYPDKHAESMKLLNIKQANTKKSKPKKVKEVITKTDPEEFTIVMKNIPQQMNLFESNS